MQQQTQALSSAARMRLYANNGRRDEGYSFPEKLHREGSFAAVVAVSRKFGREIASTAPNVARNATPPG